MPLYGVEGVKTDLAEFVKKYGGSAAEFQQSDYIDKLIGKRQMTESLRGGVCQGLSAMWIASRGDWSVFKNIIQTPGGIAHVRGFMNLQHEGIRIDSLKGRRGVTDYFIELVRIFGVGFTKEEQSGDVVNPLKISQFVAAKTGFVYCNFYGPTGGHSIAFASTGLTHAMYDPNFGVAAISNKGAFTRFTKDIFNAAYPAMNQHWYVLRFVARSGKH